MEHCKLDPVSAIGTTCCAAKLGIDFLDTGGVTGGKFVDLRRPDRSPTADGSSAVAVGPGCPEMFSRPLRI
jgi:hypothetical protein